MTAPGAGGPAGAGPALHPRSTVAVTGATGFIGRRLVRTLCRRGHPVRVLVRRPARATALAADGCELVAGDLADREALTALVAGADCLVHLAGAVRGASYATFRHANVDGSRNLFLAAAGTPAPPRLLFLSSLAAREPQLSWYARAKREAEGALAASAAPGQCWTVLRPPPVYGPGDRELLPLLKLMARGVAPLPGSAGARVSLLHVDDLVAACLVCLAADGARGETLSLHDGRTGGYAWRDIADTVARLRGRPVRLLPLPRTLLDLTAGGNLLAARVLRRAPMLTPSKLRELRHPDWVTDNAAIAAATGWRPTIDLAGGLATLPGLLR